MSLAGGGETAAIRRPTSAKIELSLGVLRAAIPKVIEDEFRAAFASDEASPSARAVDEAEYR